MTHEIDCGWRGDMAFAAHIDGHEILLDAEPAFGGKDAGPRPKALTLVSLAGCTGMDVVSILKKMREPVSWFNVKARGELTEEQPKSYASIVVVYQFKAADGLNDQNVRKAIELSQERYCGVNALLKKATKVAYELEYL